MRLGLIRKVIRNLEIHTILWIISAVMLFITIMGLHNSAVIKDYRCVDGEIIDVEEKQVIRKFGIQNRYNYTIVWYDDGICYEKSIHNSFDRPDESLTKVWANADNTDAVLVEPSEAKKNGYIYMGVTIITFILGLLLRTKQDKKKQMSMDQMETAYYTAIVTAVMMVFGDLLMLFIYWNEKSKHAYVTPVYWDLAGAFTVVFVGAIVVAVKLKKKLNNT